MSGRWARVKLGEMLKRSEQTIAIRPDQEYREVTVKLWGKGVVLRGIVSGASISSSNRYLAKLGQFILSRIDARNGANGLVPEELDGAVVTNDFPLFDLNPERVEAGFLAWLGKTRDFVELCLRASEGTTNRVRLKEDRFLALEIPLPPLAEQQRIVARIEALAAEIHEARGLRRQAVEQTEAFTASSLNSFLLSAFTAKPLGELLSPKTTISYGVLVPGPDVDNGVPFVRVQDLSVHNAAQQPNKRIAADVDAQYERTRLRGGEVLIGVVGSIGKIGIAPPSWAGANIARAVCRIVPGPELDRDYLARVLSAQPCQDYFREATRTLAQPTLNVGQLSMTPIPVPRIEEQRRIIAELDALQAEVDTLKRHQADTATELDALLPAVLDQAFRGKL